MRARKIIVLLVLSLASSYADDSKYKDASDYEGRLMINDIKFQCRKAVQDRDDWGCDPDAAAERCIAKISKLEAVKSIEHRPPMLNIVFKRGDVLSILLSGPCSIKKRRPNKN